MINLLSQIMGRSKDNGRNYAHDPYLNQCSKFTVFTNNRLWSTSLRPTPKQIGMKLMKSFTLYSNARRRIKILRSM